MRRATLSLRVGHAVGFALAVAALGGLAGCKSGSSNVQSAAGDVVPATTAAAGAVSAASPVISALTAAVPGLSAKQATLGAGALLGLAKARIPGDQFGRIAQAIPGADALIGDAVKAGLPSQLSGLASLTPFLSKEGISSSTVDQMIPALGNIVSKSAGPELASTLTSALR
jgi:hypothetical protein